VVVEQTFTIERVQRFQGERGPGAVVQQVLALPGDTPRDGKVIEGARKYGVDLGSGRPVRGASPCGERR
jgi:hypothetical protein